MGNTDRKQIVFKVLTPINNLKAGEIVTVPNLFEVLNHKSVSEAQDAAILEDLIAQNLISPHLTSTNSSDEASDILAILSHLQKKEGMLSGHSTIAVVRIKGKIYHHGQELWTVDKIGQLRGTHLDVENLSQLRWLSSKGLEIFLKRDEAEIRSIEVALEAGSLQPSAAREGEKSDRIIPKQANEENPFMKAFRHFLRAEVDTAPVLSVKDIDKLYDYAEKIADSKPMKSVAFKQLLIGAARDLVVRDMEGRTSDALDKAGIDLNITEFISE